MKYFLFIALTISSFSTFASSAFQGIYSQKTAIISNETQEEEEVNNTIIISKVLDIKDIYFVNISTVGGHIHTCDLSVEMKKIGNILTYQSKENNCSVRITKKTRGIQIKANQCEEYCGMGISLEGTGRGFIKKSDGNSIDRSQEVGD